MAKYINVDALGIGKARRDVFNDHAYADGWNSAIEIMQNAPAADVVPVVRCKDCKHSYEDLMGRCCAFGACVDCIVPDDFFCAYGVKMDESEGKGNE